MGKSMQKQWDENYMAIPRDQPEPFEINALRCKPANATPIESHRLFSGFVNQSSPPSYPGHPYDNLPFHLTDNPRPTAAAIVALCMFVGVAVACGLALWVTL